MNEYYRAFLEALTKGSIERRTVTGTGSEAIFHDGKLIASTDMNTDYSEADLVETVKAEPHLILFGAGHVGKALYDLAMLQKMRITVLDDRPELLTKERFPHALCIVAPFSELLTREYDAISPAYIIFTHGHSYDTDCLRYCLKHSYSYLGMIGSKTKSEKALEKMAEEGFSAERISTVHTPIGLSIGAETPEEIAISIMAEIISCFRSEKHFSVADIDTLKAMTTAEGTEVRIIRKTGSAPRAVGSTMFVTKERIYGTIGGGAIEKEAIEEALNLKGSLLIKEYDLTNNGDIGMVCGGKEILLFRTIS